MRISLEQSSIVIRLCMRIFAEILQKRLFFSQNYNIMKHISFIKIRENMKIKSTVLFCTSLFPLRVSKCSFSRHCLPTGFAEVLQ